MIGPIPRVFLAVLVSLYLVFSTTFLSLSLARQLRGQQQLQKKKKNAKTDNLQVCYIQRQCFRQPCVTFLDKK